MDTHLFSNFQGAVNDILTTGKFRNEPFARSFSGLRETKEEAPKKAVEDLLEYLQKLTKSLESRFKQDFSSKFNQEVKDVFDFNFMVGLSHEQDENKIKSYLQKHGIESLKKLIKRESPIAYSYERESLILKQYNAFKIFSFRLLETTYDKDIDMLNIKNNALVESSVCKKCHHRINMKQVTKHVQRVHSNEDTEFFDTFALYSSMKILHGVCHYEKYYYDKKLFLALALKIAMKTPNEAVVESIESILSLHSAKKLKL